MHKELLQDLSTLHALEQLRNIFAARHHILPAHLDFVLRVRHRTLQLQGISIRKWSREVCVVRGDGSRNRFVSVGARLQNTQARPNDTSCAISSDKMD